MRSRGFPSARATVLIAAAISWRRRLGNSAARKAFAADRALNDIRDIYEKSAEFA